MQLADGLEARGEAGVNHVAVLGDELPAEGDSVEILRVDGDELRRRIGLQGCLRVSHGPDVYMNGHMQLGMLTHGDVEDGLERPKLVRHDCLPVQVIQRLDIQSILGRLFRSIEVRCFTFTTLR